MEMSLRQRSLTPKKEVPQNTCSKRRSQTNKKNVSMAPGLDDRSIISIPANKTKKEKLYHIINTVIKNDEVQYLGEISRRKKIFTRKALLENHEQFEEVLKYYREEVVKMVKYLHLDNLHKCEQNA